MSAPREVENEIRKLRKKLRQIEHLERIDRDFTEEERVKVSRKSFIRGTLLDLLSQNACNDHKKLNTSNDTEYDTSIESVPSISEQSFSYIPNEENENLNEDDEDMKRTYEASGDSGNSNSQSPLSKENIETSQVPRASGDTIINTSSSQKCDIQVDSRKDSSTVTHVTDVGSPAKKIKPESQSVADASTQNKICAKKLRDQKNKWCKRKFSVQYLEGHNDLICSLDMNDQWLLSGSRDTTVKLWNLDLCVEEKSLGGHTGSVTAVLLLSSQQSQDLAVKYGVDYNVRLAISGSTDCSIKVWDLSSGHQLKSIYTYNPVTCLAYLPNIQSIISGSGGGKLELWNAESGENMQSIRAHEDAVTNLKVKQDHIYSSSVDGEIKLYKLRNQMLSTLFVSENVKTLSGHDVIWRPIHCIQALNDHIYYGDDGTNVKILDWKQGIIHKLKNHTCEFGATDAMCIEGDILMTSGYDLDIGVGYINVRSLPQNDYLCTIGDENNNRITDLAYNETKDGCARIVMGGIDLVLLESTTNRSDADDVIHAKYISQYDTDAVHSEIDSDENLSDSDTEEGAVSKHFRRRGSQLSQDSNKGWLSWCNLL